MANALGDRILDQPQLRHRQTHALGEALHDREYSRVYVGILLRRHGLRRVHREGHLIGKEITEEIQGHRDCKRDVKAVAASEHFSASQKQTAQYSEEKNRLQTVHKIPESQKADGVARPPLIPKPS